MQKADMLRIIDSILPEVIEARHRIHQHPELAGKEFETAKLVRSILNQTSIALREPYLETDVVGLLAGNSGDKNVTLRADMDALPLQENSDCAYKSKRDGIMHGCGHDGHTAMLIGVALVLNRLRDSFSGSVRFVFQPGEEIAALGRDLVEAGALKDPTPNAVFALHACSNLIVGVISSKAGPVLAAAGFFRVIVTGKGGHGSRPEDTIDPILIGSRIVESLQSIVSRNVSPLDSAVVSVCRFSGGHNANIIPDQIELEGTVRYLNPELGKTLPGRVEQVVRSTCAAAGATCEFSYEEPYIPTINDPGMTQLGRDTALEYLGEECWKNLENPGMGGEDFAYYIREYPGAFFRIGMGEGSPGLHNPKFDFNDEAMRNGILFMTAMALKVLD